MSESIEKAMLSLLKQNKVAKPFITNIMEKDINLRVPLLAISVFLESFDNMDHFSPQLIEDNLGIDLHSAQFYLGILVSIHVTTIY
jgi:hypothetical protein